MKNEREREKNTKIELIRYKGINMNVISLLFRQRKKTGLQKENK